MEKIINCNETDLKFPQQTKKLCDCKLQNTMRPINKYLIIGKITRNHTITSQISMHT